MVGNTREYRTHSARPGFLAALVALLPIEVIALYLSFLRDALGGVIRYYGSIYGVGAVWFIPDAFAFLCIGVFVYRACQTGNLLALAFFAYILFSLFVGFQFLGSSEALASSAKLIAPFFIGLCFMGRDFGNYRRLIKALTVLLYISVIGVILSNYIEFPWVGFSFEAFGVERDASRLWWSQEEQRLSGFTTENTSAALSILTLFMIASFKHGLTWCMAVGAVCVYAILLTTSKTAAGVLALFLLTLTVTRLLPAPKQYAFCRFLCLLSFAAPLFTILLMIVFSGVDLASSYPILFSLEDRINNSWQLPFVHLWQLMPEAFVTGCGLGCFNYPHLIFSELRTYWVPVDNFFVSSYLMFGAPFVVFLVLVFRAILNERDPYKLTFCFVMNIFSVTVISYTPLIGLILLGAGYSAGLSTRPRARVVTRRPHVQDPVPPAGLLHLPLNTNR